jgi:hypothetical protein
MTGHGTRISPPFSSEGPFVESNEHTPSLPAESLVRFREQRRESGCDGGASRDRKVRDVMRATLLEPSAVRRHTHDGGLPGRTENKGQGVLWAQDCRRLRCCMQLGRLELNRNRCRWRLCNNEYLRLLAAAATAFTFGGNVKTFAVMRYSLRANKPRAPSSRTAANYLLRHDQHQTKWCPITPTISVGLDTA